ncbi:glycosyltransferase family 9 protein [Agriterribacter sp.]|uniref:glycosyltransferase family 9 protein n=1 Tax=Agriterribacter sp. TaxID=2821509 RepID=UPI002C6E06D4|nr:glycosyltransferase family 9 protein [Agriterribacter sp.]HTN06930.1 glycosyltransferase family 9 protein [Agriterribacter sp.]
MMKKILIIQTAFIGDVVLATCLVEKLHAFFPDAQIDFLLRKGNEGLLKAHPHLHEVLIWDKQHGKYSALWRLLQRIRKNKYDKVINVQRFGATGLLTAFSKAKQKIGFDKNPFSPTFDISIKHNMCNSSAAPHETERNLSLIQSFTDSAIYKPRLYPSQQDRDSVQPLMSSPYICIAPASVWFTKQYPAQKWISFINKIPASYTVYLLGAPGEAKLCEEIQQKAERKITSLAGQFNFLQSAALMRGAVMNYVNDSAPMHFASAMNAPVTAVYCSTVPAFGYGPLSDKKYIVEIQEPLRCRPCGLHGYRQCPEGHFKCAYLIGDEQLLEPLINVETWKM